MLRKLSTILGILLTLTSTLTPALAHEDYHYVPGHTDNISVPASDFYVPPKPQAPKSADVTRFNNLIQEYMRGANDLFKGVMIKDKTLVVLVSDLFQYSPKKDRVEMLRSLVDAWNYTIGHQYRTGVAMRTVSGVWLGGMDTNTFEFYPPEK